MLKCYFSQGSELRHGGNRIDKNIRKFAPDWVTFVNSYDESDFCIYHHQYKHDLDFIVNNCKKPFIFFISELQQEKEYHQQFFANPYLKMTYTFHPLRELGLITENNKANHVHAPWGIDLDFFNVDIDVVMKSNRNNNILATGFYDSENYSQLYMATKICKNNGKMIHLDFKYWDFLRQGMVFDPDYHWYKEYVSDEELVKLFMSCKFVSALRNSEGFETVSLEGGALGARPIAFDSLYYRPWYKDIAVMIPESYDVDLVNNLIPVFNNYEKYKMTKEEVLYIREKFGWQTIATNFWNEVKQSLRGF